MEHQGSESSDTSQHIADIIQHPDLVEYFYQAVERGYDKAVKELLDQFKKEECSLIVNKKYTNKGKCFEPMLTACEKGHQDVIKALLLNGGAIEKHNKLGLNCLHIACEVGNLEIVTLLCAGYSNNRKALLDAKSLNTWTPLMFAIKGKHTTIINYLMSLPEVTIDSVTKKGRNVVHFAAQYSLECLKALQSSHRVSSDLYLATDMQGWGVLHCACTSDSDNTDTLKWLLELRTNKGDVLAPTDEGLYSNELPLLFGEKLNEKTKNGYTPLLVACEYKHKNMVQYFLELEMIGNRIVECKEHDISKRSRIVDTSVFISMDDNSGGMTGLHISAVHDTPDIAELLIKHKCPTRTQDREGDTALHIARRRSSFEVGEVLTKLNDSTLHGIKNKNNEKADEISSEEVIPVEILRRGPEAVRNYHKALKDGKQKINECKLVVLGEARVGKTSLLHNMTGIKFNPKLDSTRGIENQCIETMIDTTTIEIGSACNCNWKRIDEKEQANKHVQAFAGTVKHLFETDNKDSSNEASIQITEDELLHKIRTYLGKLRISPEIKELTGKINVPTKDQMKQNTSLVKDDNSESISNSNQNPSDNVPNQTIIKPRMDPQSSVAAEAKKDTVTLPQPDKPNTGPQPSQLNLPVPQRIGFGRRDALYMKSLACATEPTLCLNALDFAGQKEYRPMHHCFMSRRAIYVVVCNLQHICDSFADLKYWLDSIHAHVHNPGYNKYEKYIFLVGTHKNPGSGQREITDSDLEKLSCNLQKYLFGGNCCFKDEIHFYSNTDLIITGVENSLDQRKSGIEVIKKEIEIFSKSLPFLAEEYPIKWLHFRAKLLKHKLDGSPILNLTVAGQIAKDCGVDEPTMHTALQLFHDSGVIIYPAVLKSIFLEDSEKTQINAIILTEPRWLIGIMKKVMEVKMSHLTISNKDIERLKSTGRTTADVLFDLWQDDHHKDDDRFQLMCLLMRAHGLMQDITQPVMKRPLQYLFPSILSQETQTNLEGYTFYFDFKGFLPQEVFHCFICLVIKKCQEPPPKCWANACIWYCMKGYDWSVQLLSGEHKLKVVANPLDDESERLDVTKCVGYIDKEYIRPICEQSGLPGLCYVAGPLVNPCKKKSLNPCHSVWVLAAHSYPIIETSWPVKCKECGTKYTYDDISKLLEDSLQSKRQQIHVAAPTLPVACKELEDVIEWETIGQKLVGDVTIEDIKSDTTLKNMKARKRKMLRHWLDNDLTATWCKLAQSLEGVHGVCANKIHHKYCGTTDPNHIKVSERRHV